MAGNAKFEELRRATNPLFNDRKLKLGTFCTNLSGGCAFTTMPGTLDITWPNTLRLAQIADQMEFEALVPVGRITLARRNPTPSAFCTPLASRQKGHFAFRRGDYISCKPRRYLVG